ncbi:hypothetical protein CTA1_4639 [Colletotrichum tanaceti]|uniref:Uncharacterized protein n=1 Tax=Colletotrichum tanaceti TaxID=1306861 RepID=A0A4U6X8Q7_9PEZI|nr:hypothetical protein CTA1_4639 [Colletotrichum tanaceti]
MLVSEYRDMLQPRSHAETRPEMRRPPGLPGPRLPRAPARRISVHRTHKLASARESIWTRFYM